MGKTPLVLRNAVPRLLEHDASTLEEELPASVARDADGFLVSRQSTYTCVTQETTDDN